MNKPDIHKVLAMSNSAVGRWADRAAPPPVPLQERKVLAYERYSSAGQREATIEKQEEFIEAHCLNRGMGKPKHFADRAVSGVSDDRAAWKEMMRLVDSTAVVVIHEITRLARETLTALKMIHQVQKAGGMVEIVNIQTQDTIYLTIMSAVAEYDYRSVNTRLRDGRMQAVARGVPYRKTPFGYTKVGKDFEINEAEARWVREIFQMRLAGSTTIGITNHLNRLKAPTRSGSNWTPTRISQILYNPIYAGVLVAKRPLFAWEKTGS